LIINKLIIDSRMRLRETMLACFLLCTLMRTKRSSAGWHVTC